MSPPARRTTRWPAHWATNAFPSQSPPLSKACRSIRLRAMLYAESALHQAMLHRATLRARATQDLHWAHHRRFAEAPLYRHSPCRRATCPHSDAAVPRRSRQPPRQKLLYCAVRPRRRRALRWSACPQVPPATNPRDRHIHATIGMRLSRFHSSSTYLIMLEQTAPESASHFDTTSEYLRFRSATWRCVLDPYRRQNHYSVCCHSQTYRARGDEPYLRQESLSNPCPYTRDSLPRDSGRTRDPPRHLVR